MDPNEITPPTELDAPPFVRGLTWEQMPVGLRFKTATRTVTETDLVTFVNLAGFNEPLFTDASGPLEMGYSGRLVPGAFVYSLAEGLVIQSHCFHGTGMAMLHATLTVPKPTFVGDTLHVVVEILESRASSRPGRGVVTSQNTVVNQRGAAVAGFKAVRLIKGAGADG